MRICPRFSQEVIGMKLIFDQYVFETFQIESVEGRMTAIQERIQPLFRYYGEEIQKLLAEQGLSQPIHIAKHLRRKTHPAPNTWVAIGGDKRGYKKYPHIEFGINPEYVFITLSIIDQPLNEIEIAQGFSQMTTQFQNLPSDIIIIPDHTQLAFIKQDEADYHIILKRLETVKKAEFMIGRLAFNGEELLQNQEAISSWIRDTLLEIMPFYLAALKISPTP